MSNSDTVFKDYGDFKEYYDKKQKRNYWVLGYFGGGSINISQAAKIAAQYSSETNVPEASVVIDEIFQSRRFKGFKFIYSPKRQQPTANAEQMEDVWKWLSD